MAIHLKYDYQYCRHYEHDYSLLPFLLVLVNIVVIMFEFLLSFCFRTRGLPDSNGSSTCSSIEDYRAKIVTKSPLRSL